MDIRGKDDLTASERNHQGAFNGAKLYMYTRPYTCMCVCVSVYMCACVSLIDERFYSSSASIFNISKGVPLAFVGIWLKDFHFITLKYS